MHGLRPRASARSHLRAPPRRTDAGMRHRRGSARGPARPLVIGTPGERVTQQAAGPDDVAGGVSQRHRSPTNVPDRQSARATRTGAGTRKRRKTFASAH